MNRGLKDQDVVLNPLGANADCYGNKDGRVKEGLCKNEREEQAALIPRFGSFDEHWKWAGTAEAEQGRADFVKLMAVNGLDCSWEHIKVQTDHEQYANPCKVFRYVLTVRVRVGPGDGEGDGEGEGEGEGARL